jgi:hypothetical protein
LPNIFATYLTVHGLVRKIIDFLEQDQSWRVAFAFASVLPPQHPIDSRARAERQMREHARNPFYHNQNDQVSKASIAFLAYITVLYLELGELWIRLIAPVA